MLANKDIIDWKVYKTNHDYAYEIQDEQYRMPFSQLSYLFEYVWYGDFEAGNQHYTTMRHALDELKDKLRQDA
ncbi:MAG: DUF4129 domain-containing protein [Cyclobacteriaceae bacterium]|nr:DUF4129 domain-containing protein [Cyclobacteriaceae bacterium]